MIIQVLYEDSAAVANNYGLHNLVLACVADALGQPNWRRLGAEIKGLAKKGNSKLRTTLDEDGQDLGNDGPLLAMFDVDRVREPYKLPASATEAEVVSEILKTAGDSPTIVLLDRNLETVVEACCVALKRDFPGRKLKPAESDPIFQKAAGASADVREAVLARVPSLRKLVHEIVRAKKAAEAPIAEDGR